MWQRLGEVMAACEVVGHVIVEPRIAASVRAKETSSRANEREEVIMSTRGEPPGSLRGKRRPGERACDTWIDDSHPYILVAEMQ